MVVKCGGHTGSGSSGGLHHGSGGEVLGFLFVECGFDGVKITTLVILTKVENAKVLTKLLRDVFTFSLFVLSLDEDFSSQSGDTNFVLVLPL